MCYAGFVKRAVIRLPNEILGRLDQLAEQLNAACPGRRFSRAAVARILLTTGLCLADVEAAGFGKAVLEGGSRAGGRRPP